MIKKARGERNKVWLELSAVRAAMVRRSSQALAIPIYRILGPHALPHSKRGHCSAHGEPDSASHLSQTENADRCLGRLPQETTGYTTPSAKGLFPDSHRQQGER